ncbi:MFS transporter [Sphingomonas sp. PAMC 26617]|uniref:MFS transporter n=1 Tax=Sphingomonas sp. PAMC 26617 TaxID=1112216 RepID=UPI0003049AFB|nr:MFS transporter [Sphingomonas sp. PAMC 26617]
MTVEAQRAGARTSQKLGIVVDDGRRSGMRWIILALVCFIYMLVAADRANLGVAIPAIKAEFRISNAEAGLFATLMFVCFAVSNLPSSIVTRRYGPRFLMIGGLVVAALASFLIGTSTSPAQIKVFRSLLGVAEAAISICCMTTINQWFSTRERGTAAGFYWGSSKLGPVICPPIAVVILQSLGWRAIFQIFAVPVLVAAIIWFFFVRSKPEESRFVSSAELRQIRDAEPATSTKANVREARAVPAWLDRVIRLRTVKLIDTAGGVLRSWNLIGVALATIFMVGIFNVFLAWIPSYLLNAKHLPLATSGVLASTLFAGAVAGNFAGGWISDRLLGQRRKPLMMAGALCTTIAITSLLFAPASVFLLGALLVATGFVVGLGYPHFTTYPMSLTSREVYPIAYGALATGAALGAAFFPYIAGLILDASNWNVVFLFLAGSSLICLLFLATIDEPRVEAS